ncbi:hypothetical protein [Pasteuria penetrans]|uniref:hypothetical protein n=1 Tax=Pasteuria penetrans TaxID=86005 RepID=UPI000F9FCA89|nr:hypothetical protein [Pasteuria penetrans]
MGKNTKMIFSSILSITAFFTATFHVIPYAEGKDEAISPTVYDENLDEKQIDEDVRRVKKLLKEEHLTKDEQRMLKRLMGRNKDFINNNLKKIISDKKPEWANLSPSEQINKLVEEMSHSFALSNDKGPGSLFITTDTDEGTIRSIVRELESPGAKIHYQHTRGQWLPLSSVPL